jgi:hypothetical protein
LQGQAYTRTIPARRPGQPIISPKNGQSIVSPKNGQQQQQQHVSMVSLVGGDDNQGEDGYYYDGTHNCTHHARHSTAHSIELNDFA